MKVAHLADVHLGFRQYSRQTPEGVNQRESDVATAFQRAIDDVVRSEPDLVLIAGDLFHSVRPTNTAILHAFDQLRRLRRALPECPVVIVAGNHDTPRSTETGTILKLFEALGGVTAVTRESRELVFEQFDLAVTCVPHSALSSDEDTLPVPMAGASRNVLVLHGEVEGVLDRGGSAMDYGGFIVDPEDLRADRWDYVALGHYHVARPVLANAWYSGSVDYVSTNPWGELVDEEDQGRRGKKGWLLVDLSDAVDVEFRPVDLERNIIDLEPIEGAGCGAAELDSQIAERLLSIPGGFENDIIRQVVHNVTRPVVHDMDHKRIREFKAEALHFNLDIRRPASRRSVGVGAPGTRQTLSDMVKDYLERRPLAKDVDRKELVGLGMRYMDDVEKDLLEE